MAFIPSELGGISLLPAYSPWQPEAQPKQTVPLPLPSPSPGRAPAPLSPQATDAAGPLVALSLTSRRMGQTARVFH